VASTDYFLKLEGIDGESTDDKHKGEIDILSWSWGVQQTGTHQFGGGGGAGKASPSDISMAMKVNKASPTLFLNCATGTHIPKGTLTVRKAGGEQQEYYKIELEDILVSSYQTGGSGGSELPIDSFSLNFGKMSFEYKPQKKDGTLDSPVKTGYDYKANKKV
jgi:type VI secretion system secreted protein Hcp